MADLHFLANPARFRRFSQRVAGKDMRDIRMVDHRERGWRQQLLAHFSQ